MGCLYDVPTRFAFLPGVHNQVVVPLMGRDIHPRENKVNVVTPISSLVLYRAKLN